MFTPVPSTRSCILAGLTVLLVIGAALAARGNARPKDKPAAAASAAVAAAADSRCPSPDGYFPDEHQCDKYYACTDGKPQERLCPDGMVFNDYDIDVEKCDLPYNIDCTKRTKLQTPIPSQHCPRQNGYFAHADTSICDTFYYCVAGMYNMITCPAGLVFSSATGICTWPEQAKKSGCSSHELFAFDCPKVSEAVAQTHPRYADPEDCQYFYVCVNGDMPRKNGCKLGQAFDDASKRCEWARRVPECADWYKGQLTDAQLDELENPKQAVKGRVKGQPLQRRKGQTAASAIAERKAAAAAAAAAAASDE